jgi:hypothetical protein
MRPALLAISGFAIAAVPAFAQLAATDRSALELGPRGTATAALLEIVIPDVASGRSQKRPITDLMLRLSSSDGKIDGALRLPNGVAADRDSGLMRAQVYVVSGGRLLGPTEVRCDRWIEDLAVCSVACDGGAFGVKRRIEAAKVSLTLVVGHLPRGTEEGAQPGFNLKACAAPDAKDELLAPGGNRPLVEIPMIAK